MKRTAKANWSGDLKSGHGTLTTKTGTLTGAHYSFNSRFDEGDKGTNPEELLAAAHAGCFTMAVVATLGKKCSNAITLETVATVLLRDLNIIGIHLSITGFVPGISEETFRSVAREAEKICLISKILCIPIRMEAHFAQHKEMIPA
jgi:osmotically inducible protein OsmC